MTHWKNKKDRAYAHELLQKAWQKEFAAEKKRIIQTAAAMDNIDDIYELAKSMRAFIRDVDDWYIVTFSDMDIKIRRHYRRGLLSDDDLAGLTPAQLAELRLDDL